MANIQPIKSDHELEIYKEEFPETVSVWYSDTLMKWFKRNPIIAQYAVVGEGKTFETRIGFIMLDGMIVQSKYTFKDLVSKAIVGYGDELKWASPTNVKWGNKQWEKNGGIEEAMVRKTIMECYTARGIYEALKSKVK